MVGKEESGPSETRDSETATVSAAEIRLQLRRIFESAEFHATEKQRDFLRFVVDETLAGTADRIKGFTVATRVFGRKKDFDQATDPIVSIQANRLRRALERYYLVVGRGDPVRIDIPKGSYVPTFERGAGEGGRGGDLHKEVPEERSYGSWPTVLIRPFKNLNCGAELNYLSIGLATELAIELTRYQDLRVLMHPPGGERSSTAGAAVRFAVEGSVRKDRTGIKLTVHLVDQESGSHIWSHSYTTSMKAARVIAFQEETARIVAARLCSEQGVISKTLSIESRRVAPTEMVTYEAILQFLEFNATFEPEAYFRTLKALRHAVATEPECGKAWSMLARLYTLNLSLELFDPDGTLDEALVCAERGVQLSPANQFVRLVLAYVRFFMNDLQGGTAEVERSLALNSRSLIFLDSIGYLLTLMGDWERGPALTRKAIRLNPYYNDTVHYGLWVDWLRKGKYKEAYRETKCLAQPNLFWQPLARASTLGLLGRVEEGERAAAGLLALKPDFPTRGRALIGHYVKFDDVFDRIEEGLRLVGVEVE